MFNMKRRLRPARLALAVVLSLFGVAAATPALAAPPVRPAVSSPAVPWQLAGPGWALAVFDADSISGITAGPQTLYLVSPAGGRYKLYTWAANSAAASWIPVDWSARSDRVVFESIGSRTGVHVLSLRTGHVTSFAVSASQAVAGFVQPAGDQLVIGTIPLSGKAPTSFLLYSLAGRRLRTLVTVPALISGLAYSPSGGQVAVGNGPGLELLDAGGRLIRMLPIRAGAGASCAPIRWWSARVLLADCLTSLRAARGRSVYARLWLVPVNGGTPALLNRASGASASDAWRLTSGLYAQGRRSDLSDLERLKAGGGAVVVRVPGSRWGSLVYGATRSRLLVQRNAFEGSSSLVWLNPATGAVTVAIPASPGVYGVIWVVPFFASGAY
jgi:hypothetical protein